ncbi:flagellar hook-length control protein FliK [Actibacterium lipolyticum]|nr:flagellar hook-length control protein FliK [Actibacterium lipolyticum]
MMPSPQVAVPLPDGPAVAAEFTAILMGKGAVTAEEVTPVDTVVEDLEVEDPPEFETVPGTAAPKELPLPVPKGGQQFLPDAEPDMLVAVTSRSLGDVQNDAGPPTEPPLASGMPGSAADKLAPAVANMIPDVGAADQSLDLPDPLPILEPRSSAEPTRIAQTVSVQASQAPVIRQVVEIAHATQQGTVEVALNPEELGKVRMNLSTSEGSISVSILAERPETTELLRNNIDALGKELRALGYSDLSFDFAGDAGQQGQHGDNPDAPQGAADPAESELTKTIVTLSDGLDIRI